jgi:hypothetical protein
MTITLTREEAQQVLDALECMNEGALNAEIKLLRARLSAPEPEPIATLFGSLPVYEVSPEPVAYITKRKSGGTEGLLRADMVDRSAKNQETHDFIPLYKDPTPCQTCEALARTVMMDQTSHDTKKKWIGLTDEEMLTVAWQAGFDIHEDYDNEDMSDHWWTEDGEQCDETLFKLRDLISAKLREKNS